MFAKAEVLFYSSMEAFFLSHRYKLASQHVDHFSAVQNSDGPHLRAQLLGSRPSEGEFVRLIECMNSSRD